MERILFGVLFLSDWVILSSCLPHQYHFVNVSLNWTEAQTYCRQTHTDMATILSTEEQNQLIQTLSSAGYSSNVWIGLFSEIDWKWSDGFTGTGADYRHWRTISNEPSFHYSEEFCVMFAYHGDWFDVKCSGNRDFLCYKGTQMNPEFVYVDQPMNWSSAQKYCRENYVDLATIKSDADHQNIQSLVPTNSHPWIGLYRDPNFHWSDGSSIPFTNLWSCKKTGHKDQTSNRRISGSERCCGERTHPDEAPEQTAGDQCEWSYPEVERTI